MTSSKRPPAHPPSDEQPSDSAQLPADPIREGAAIVAGENFETLERRLKTDIFNSLCRIKPEMKSHDFETEIMTGILFPNLAAPLQGVAIARVEGTLAFYNRVGWHPQYLTEPLSSCVSDSEAAETLKTRYHASTLHDLAYVHPKHFEKILGKAGAAQLWEQMKRFGESLA